MDKVKKRKSFVLEPRTPSTSLVDLNDDAQETEERRNLRRDRSADTPATARSSEMSIDRAKLAKMTAAEKLQHTEKCIQLSAANKIGINNAFNLLLIDQMVEMVKAEEANFQVAGTHLDVSTKIYAARVDRVHADAMRFAGGLSSNKPRPAVQEGDEEDEEGAALPPTENGAAADKPKKKNKRRSRNVIQKDSKVLKSTAHLRMVNIGDLHIQKLLTCQEASEPGNSHFLLTLPTSGEDYKMLLQGDVLAFPPVCPEIPSECFMRMPDFRKCLSMPLLPEEIQSMLAEGELDRTQTRISPSYLPSAEPEDDEDDVPANDFGMDGFSDNEGGDYADKDEDPFWHSEEVRAQRQVAMGTGEHTQTTARRIMPGDYMSLHRAVLGLSAGPLDWKPPRQRPSAIIRPAAPKPVRNRAPKELDFTYSPDLFAKFGGSKHTTLTDATIEGWRRSKHLLPMPDLQRGKRFQSFFIRDRCTPCKSEDPVTKGKILENGEQVVDLDSSFSQFVFPNDDHDSDGHDDADHMDDAETLHAATCGTTLAPELQPLNYAKRAKGIDMRMLKRCTWDIIQSNLGDKENVGPSDEISFTDIYAQLPAKLSSKMAANLSPALAFMSVLHLANEHSLELKNPADLTELYVRKGSE